MKLIRKNIFETNSSSTHSISICKTEDFDKWVKGELLYDVNNKTFVKLSPEELERQYRILYLKGLFIYDWDTRTVTFKDKTISIKDNFEVSEQFLTDENLNSISKEDLDEFISELSYYEKPYVTYDEYNEGIGEYYELYEVTYTTESGDEIMAFGYYGYDM